jgi:hypothetical protein
VAGTGPVGATGDLKSIPSYIFPMSPVSSPVPNDMASQVTLRGLPSADVAKLVAAASVPLGAGSVAFPVMNVGAGAHVDSMVMAPHTHSLDEGGVGSHMAVRQSFISSSGLALGGDHFGDIKKANPLIELAKGQLT